MTLTVGWNVTRRGLTDHKSMKRPIDDRSPPLIRGVARLYNPTSQLPKILLQPLYISEPLSPRLPPSSPSSKEVKERNVPWNGLPIPSVFANARP